LTGLHVREKDLDGFLNAYLYFSVNKVKLKSPIVYGLGYFLVNGTRSP
jgi:hypothetical protein